ncbi:MAG: S8 family serine peptidase [Oscillospiraceae bacterium]|jgi:serine protease|nr:S8 family serine peptidase [Oscillospiraceae bacterium]
MKKQHLKRLAALVLALVVAAGGSFWAWHWFRRAGETGPQGVYVPLLKEYPAPDPVRFDPPDPNPPPVVGYRPDPAHFAVDAATGTEFVKNIVVVYFAREATDAQKQAAMDAVGGSLAGQADIIGRRELEVAAENLADIETLCARLEAMPGVTGASPDRVVRLVPQQLPNDPFKASGFTTEATNKWWVGATRLPEAWDYNDETPGTVALGLLDATVFADHEEFDGGIAEMVTYYNDQEMYVPQPTGPNVSHATGIAGIMAAKANNSKGLAGVAWNAKVYGIDIYAQGATESVIYDGIAALLAKGVRAVNLSAGVMTDANPNGASDPAQDAATAAKNIAQMLRYGYSNFVVVQSAGNLRSDAYKNGLFCSVTPTNTQLSATEDVTPQMVCNRILVAGALEAAGSAYKQTYFSATGNQVSLYAPGRQLFLPAGNHAYQLTQGTSFSAPQVAAAAAWMLTLNPALDGGQVGALLKMEAVSPKAAQDRDDNSVSYRMLDTRRALDAAYCYPDLEPQLKPADNSPYEVSERVVKNITEKTKAVDFAAKVRAVGGTFGYAKENTRFAATGDAVTLLSPTGLVITYTLTVKGDLNGDGRADALDAQKLRLQLEGLWTPPYPDAVFTVAADFDGDGVVNAQDAQAIFENGMQ